MKKSTKHLPRESLGDSYNSGGLVSPSTLTLLQETTGVQLVITYNSEYLILHFLGQSINPFNLMLITLDEG